MAGRKPTNPGLERLNQVKLDSGSGTGLESDPAFADSLKEDAASLQDIDTDQDASEVMEEALEELDANDGIRAHPIANGTTIPMPDQGEDTTDFATCRKHVPGVNRGCFQANRKPRPCPFVGKGPFNFIYKDLRSGLVKHTTCVYAMKNYLRSPHIVFLDPPQEVPGEAWVPTRMATFAPLPNGQQPVPGPGQPRTRIILKAVKSRVLCVPPEGEARNFQLMRRRGEFDKPVERKRGRRVAR